MTEKNYEGVNVSIESIRTGIDSIEPGLFLTGSFDPAIGLLYVKVDTEDAGILAQIDQVVIDNEGTFVEGISGPVDELENIGLSHSYTGIEHLDIHTIDIDSYGFWVNVTIYGNTILSANSQLLHEIEPNDLSIIQGENSILIEKSGDWYLNFNVYLYARTYNMDLIASFTKSLPTDVQNTNITLIINRLNG
jgi:hypothetical protein